MSRLIDADKLIDALGLRGCYKYENPKAYDTLMLYEILGAIEDQPTAYDVEKVVKEMQRKSYFIFDQCYADGSICVLLTDDAADIVKRGGIDD